MLIIMAVSLAPLIIFNKAQKEELSAVRAKVSEFSVLEQEYLALKTQIGSFEKRGSLVKPKGILEETHSLFDSLGLKKKIKSTKGLGSREKKDSYTEESVEIIAEGLTMNEVVNLFYKIDKAPMMLSIRSFTLKRSFENPEHLNLQIGLALFVKH